MTRFTNHPDQLFDTNRPILGGVALQSRDNLVAVTEGASGAPKIRDAALSTTVNSSGVAWVAARIVQQSNSGGGRYGLFEWTGIGSIGLGTNVSGGALRYASGSGRSSVGGQTSQISPAGTWRLLGHASSVGIDAGDNASLFLRVG